ncbi:DUF883 family protein [Duganella sp. FT80W]|uniref:DUF883 family protein n=1 Tax=Duganella guangzhouensis TaxID=2666084 RepID=A0A6I2L0M9_9BURK|nr:DUF883 family protein [Duganella guangzhouensis]MRW91711.1 DUF883 family protein [Duganella guangzhouensis]
MEQTPLNGQAAIADSQAASATARDKLMNELTHTISEAEKWLTDSVEQAGGISAETRARFDDALSTARSDLRKLEDSFLAHSRNAADTVDSYVRNNPWQAAGIGAAIGVVLGLLIARK